VPAERHWSFSIIGQPAPQGSKRPLGVRGGKHIMIESSSAVGPWREAVAAAGLGAGPCLSGPLAVGMVFLMRRPTTARKRDVTPFKAPDLSKLARSTEDAITMAGLWDDDARVAIYCPLAKAYAGCPIPGLDGLVAPPVTGAIVACVEWGDEAVLTVGDLLRREVASLSKRIERRPA